ncbi:trypsin-like peptidase domain-containing protein [Streptomyces sp. R41]|uniref:Trypsin-like peptidase domain-containing protein n=1 Tax=Streptomyces sp. R41 TaxID=3238632 RepID=A0AB39R9T6_9ACTN
MTDSLWEDRLVEVWAAPGRSGSGVAFGAAGVLTALHVVGKGSPVRVLARIVRRVGMDLAGQAVAPWVPMRVVADDPDWDLAVLEVNSDDPGAVLWQAPASARPRLAEVSGAAELACESVGFPDANVQGSPGARPGDWVRQSEHAVGVLLPMGTQ